MFMPNYIKAAQIVLEDFRTGKLGRFNLDQDLLQKLRPKESDVD
jgi:ribosome biogenesis GTPase A